MTDTARTYVLDTSVLLSDPWAVTRFAEHHVVLPIAVIGELEAKRQHPELGYFAREALRLLEDVEAGLARIEDGTYGICETFGKTIGAPRLEALPTTRFCIDHA